jgi:hypothetical protein
MLVRFKPTDQLPQHQAAPIRAELAGSDTCRAEGITAHSSSPVLALCRKLIEAGHDPARPLHAYRGETLCLVIRSIGEGARLEVNGEGTTSTPPNSPTSCALSV